MGMDIFGNSDTYFRANIWQWRTICYAMHLADYKVPEGWHHNDGEGLDNQEDCDVLADKLSAFLKSWDGKVLVLESDIRIDENNKYVEENTPGSRSAYFTDREHIEEFIIFLHDCGGGFRIF